MPSSERQNVILLATLGLKAAARSSRFVIWSKKFKKFLEKIKFCKSFQLFSTSPRWQLSLRLQSCSFDSCICIWNRWTQIEILFMWSNTYQSTAWNLFDLWATIDSHFDCCSDWSEAQVYRPSWTEFRSNHSDPTPVFELYASLKLYHQSLRYAATRRREIRRQALADRSSVANETIEPPLPSRIRLSKSLTGREKRQAARDEITRQESLVGILERKVVTFRKVKISKAPSWEKE